MAIKALILAGGAGTRFWPKSTEEKPKQFLKIISEKTMIQETFDRIKNLVSKNNLFVMTSKSHSIHASSQLNLPKENIIIEPMARNTATAIAYGLYYMNNDDILIVLPSDHYIKNVDVYIKTLNAAVDFASNHDAVVTLGIKPTNPNTGYGYLEIDKNLVSGNDDKYKVFPVRRFHEKPNFETAYEYLKEGNFFWNSGMFIFKVSTMWKLFEKFLPETYKVFKNARDKEEILAKYGEFESVSIDYAIMEKADNIYMIQSQFFWSDIGSWDAIYEISEKDKFGNVSDNKNTIFRNSKNCATFSDDSHIIAVANLDDVIVVAYENRVLVTKRNTTQDIKNLDLKSIEVKSSK